MQKASVMSLAAASKRREASLSMLALLFLGDTHRFLSCGRETASSKSGSKSTLVLLILLASFVKQLLLFYNVINSYFERKSLTSRVLFLTATLVLPDLLREYFVPENHYFPKMRLSYVFRNTVNNVCRTEGRATDTRRFTVNFRQLNLFIKNFFPFWGERKSSRQKDPEHGTRLPTIMQFSHL